MSESTDFLRKKSLEIKGSKVRKSNLLWSQFIAQLRNIRNSTQGSDRLGGIHEYVMKQQSLDLHCKDLKQINAQFMFVEWWKGLLYIRVLF